METGYWLLRTLWPSANPMLVALVPDCVAFTLQHRNVLQQQPVF